MKIRSLFANWRFMREHRWTQDHLSGYLDRDLSDRQRTRLETHTGACPQCRHVLATLRRTLRALRRLGLDELEPVQPVGPGPVSEQVIGYLRRVG